MRLRAYPYPDTNRRSSAVPNNDGPIQTLQDGVGFGSDVQTVEFWPDGTAHIAAGGTQPWPAIPGEALASRCSTSCTAAPSSHRIGVNGLGKIALH